MATACLLPAYAPGCAQRAGPPNAGYQCSAYADFKTSSRRVFSCALSAGALRAEKPELLTVILPQSLSKQPPESQELLQKVRARCASSQHERLPGADLPFAAFGSELAWRDRCALVLLQVQKVVEMPHNDDLPLLEASRQVCMHACVRVRRRCLLEPGSAAHLVHWCSCTKCSHPYASVRLAQAMQCGHPPQGPAGDLLRLPRQPRAPRDVQGGQGNAQDCHSVLPRLRAERGALSAAQWPAVLVASPACRAIL